MTTPEEVSISKVDMLIRKPVKEVIEAFIDPSITTKFWFTKRSGRLEVGKCIRWDWGDVRSFCRTRCKRIGTKQ